MGHDRLCPIRAKPGDLTQAEPQGRLSIGPNKHLIIPPASIHIDGVNLHAMVAGIPHDLRGRVKAHGLGIEQRGGKDGGFMMLDPGRHPDQPGKGNRMAFRKAVRPKAFNLFEAASGKRLLIAARDHARDQLVAKGIDRAQIAKGRHRPAQLIGLARRKVCRNNGELHRLFLK